MKRLFADSFYFIALLNDRDACHRRAVDMSHQTHALIITTRWVIAEVADALCTTAWRKQAGTFVHFILTAPGFLVRDCSDELFLRGLELYRSRDDKDWSLTDCISFVAMKDEDIFEALTADRHFEQAGFVALLT